MEQRTYSRILYGRRMMHLALIMSIETNTWALGRTQCLSDDQGTPFRLFCCFSEHMCGVLEVYQGRGFTRYTLCRCENYDCMLKMISGSRCDDKIGRLLSSSVLLGISFAQQEQMRYVQSFDFTIFLHFSMLGSLSPNDGPSPYEYHCTPKPASQAA